MGSERAGLLPVADTDCAAAPVDPGDKSWALLSPSTSSPSSPTTGTWRRRGTRPALDFLPLVWSCSLDWSSVASREASCEGEEQCWSVRGSGVLEGASGDSRVVDQHGETLIRTLIPKEDKPPNKGQAESNTCILYLWNRTTPLYGQNEQLVPKA